MASKIGKSEWKFLYAVTGVIDVTQVILDFFIFGIAINPFVDFVVGVGLVIYFQWRGVSMVKRLSRAASLVGAGILGEITGGIAPAWIIDIWYIKKTVDQETAAEDSVKIQNSFLKSQMQQPLYSNGSRQPQNQIPVTNSSPKYQGGMRAPGGGLTSPKIRAKI